MLGMMDELVDGGSAQHFTKPLLGGGVERVRLNFSFERDTREGSALLHLTSLSGVHMPSISTMSVPGTNQKSSGSTVTVGGNAQLGNLSVDDVSGAFAGDYKYTSQTTETSAAGAALSQSQFMLTSNQKT
ncbi:hypothetical protein ACPXCX_52195, partial [Streptomyces sp. DT225]